MLSKVFFLIKYSKHFAEVFDGKDRMQETKKKLTDKVRHKVAMNLKLTPLTLKAYHVYSELLNIGRNVGTNRK